MNAMVKACAGGLCGEPALRQKALAVLVQESAAAGGLEAPADLALAVAAGLLERNLIHLSAEEAERLKGFGPPAEADLDATLAPEPPAIVLKPEKPAAKTKRKGRVGR